MKNAFVFSLLFIGVPILASMRTEWEYSQAIRCAQGEQWADVQHRLSNLMIDDSDNPELLYDSGVAAYRVKEYQKAEAYFHQTTRNERATSALKEKAYFNLGNTKVALNSLDEAIDPYEAALAIDPSDERARHNLEQVRELLKQQEQQQNQQNKDQQSKQDQSVSAEASSDKQQSSQNGQQEQNDSNDKQDGRQEKQEQQQKNGKEGQKGESTTEERKEQGADKQQEGERKDNANDKSNDKRRDQEQEQCGDSHDSSPQKNSESDDERQARDSDAHHTKEGDESQEMQAGELDEQEGTEDIQAKQQKELEEELAPQDRWMARVLQQRERADEKANKRIVKATIDKELAGKDGQNCW